MGTKLQPGKFDCYEAAAPDEPMFILLARDPGAPAAIAQWIYERKKLMKMGLKPPSDAAKIVEADECILAMRKWREANRP